VKDTSLTVPSGTYGIVMDVKVSSARKAARQKLTPTESKRQAKRSRRSSQKKTDELREQLTEALRNILLGEKIPLDVVNAETGEIIIPANRKITKTLLRKLARSTITSRSIPRRSATRSARSSAASKQVRRAAE
jgi:DNA-directed RNA polymerase subunit beta